MKSAQHSSFPISRRQDVSDKRLHERHQYRGVFISDLHLGTSWCLARDIVQFLNHIETRRLDAVGDNADCWVLGIYRPHKLGKLLERRVYAGQAQLTVVQKMLRLSRRGTRIILYAGNHDEVLGNFHGALFGNVRIRRNSSYRTSDGRRYFVTHGHDFDGFIRHWHWLASHGARAFLLLSKLSIHLDRLQKKLHIHDFFRSLGWRSHWSLAHAIQKREEESAYNQAYLQTVMTYLFMENAREYTRHKKDGVQPRYYNGIVCGHTHVADKLVFESPRDKATGEIIGPPTVEYWNTGHWTGPPGHENLQDEDWRPYVKHPPCTAVVEYAEDDEDGHVKGELGHVIWVPGEGIRPFTPMSKHSRLRTY